MNLDRPVLVRRVAEVLAAGRGAPEIEAILGIDSVRIATILRAHDYGDCSRARFCTHDCWAIASQCVDAVGVPE